MLRAASRLTELSILIAAPSSQAAIVDDRQHVALPARDAVHCVCIQATHSDWAQGSVNALDSQLLLIVCACRVCLAITWDGKQSACVSSDQVGDRAPVACLWRVLIMVKCGSRYERLYSVCKVRHKQTSMREVYVMRR